MRFKLKPLATMRNTRSWGKNLGAPLAVLYLFLSFAAAWHTHPVIPKSDLAYVESSSSTAAVEDNDGFCALCSWQSLAQQTATETPAVVSSIPMVVLPAPAVIDAPTSGFSQAHLARGPPSA